MSASGRSRRSDLGRRYPPLVSVAFAMALAAFVLPSALSLPQTNPTQSLEYAPVPPSDENPSTAQGNTSSLGLATSGSVQADGAGGSGAGMAPVASVRVPLGAGTVPRTKRCVGSP